VVDSFQEKRRKRRAVGREEEDRHNTVSVSRFRDSKTREEEEGSFVGYRDKGHRRMGHTVRIRRQDLELAYRGQNR